MNILIIGASSGIGRELWKHYASDGNRVAVLARRGELLQQMKNARPDHTLAICCDISGHTSLETAIASVNSEFAVIDLAIICAGIGELNPQLDIEIERETISVNVAGWTDAVNATYHVFERQGYGHLVTVTSIGGLNPTPIAPSYSASKAYQINYTRSLIKKAKGTGITVTEIRPGLVDTRMAKGDGLFWVMPLPAVTSQIVNAIRRKKKLRIVTKRWRIANFILRHFI
ncbi:MAG: SDR family NAD(P)-dependent oxidoreductase [Muribaculaceae bacterium]|nr:SDR family NAD(P)-dependent oxidoreductase [Muribaculaceae bacterium]